MPIETNLTVSPYFDDYDESKDYYKILFKPSTAVQARELNQLQTLLQKQVERFGDQIFEKGTILTGCDEKLHPEVPYVKLFDKNNLNSAVSVGDYQDLLVKNSANVVARVVNTAIGYESRNPDLNTLYLNYVNSGDDQETSTFVQNEQLTIYGDNDELFRIDVDTASANFSNNDSVVILSAIEVQNSAGGLSFTGGGAFEVGEIITQETTDAQAEIIAIDTTSKEGSVVLQIKPLTAQLAIQNTLSWAFTEEYEITGGTSNTSAIHTGTVGTGAIATLRTNGVGAIEDVSITSQGSGYYVNPHATVSVKNTLASSTSDIGTLVLDAKNYLTRVNVANTSFTDPVGTSYHLEITDGYIFQKGHFLRVEAQSIAVEKYASTPDDVAVGFVTEETIVNSNEDESLLDNSDEFLNFNAPGADRLKLVPKLTVKTPEEAEEDVEFLPIWNFSDGRMWMSDDETQYSIIGDEMAKRTYEESGNYVVEGFGVNVTSEDTFADTANTVEYEIEEGLAYIKGYRVETVDTYTEVVPKAKDVAITEDTSMDVVYGNYIRVNEFAGVEEFQDGSQISLYDGAANFVTDNYSGTISAPSTYNAASNEVGKARIRSVTLESGIPGTPEAVYRLYLFDIRMNRGRSFKNVESVYVTGTTLNGIADVILEVEAGTGATNYVAVLKESEKNTLIFNTYKAMESANNIQFTYRTLQTGLSANTLGFIDIAADSNANFPYAGALTSTEERDLIICPEADMIDTATLSGTFDSINGNNVITANSTTFTSEVEAGDWLYFDDTSDQAMARVVSVNSDLSITVAGDLSLINAGATMQLALPKGMPVPMHTKTARTATVTGTTLSIDLDIALTAPVNVTVTYNQKTDLDAPATAVTKNVARKTYVAIQANTHPNGTTGPWCLGFPDVIRLRGVYWGANTDATNITHDFYVETNQKDNYYDLSMLNIEKEGETVIGADDVILVEFDIFRPGTQGLKNINSYNIDDTLTLDELTTGNTHIHTMEIPEVNGSKNRYYDLRECFDFRPYSANTVAMQFDPASAPVNPVAYTSANESTRFDGVAKRFPIPEGDVFYNASYYEGRIDTVIINKDNQIEVIQGEKYFPEQDIDQPGYTGGEGVLAYIEVPPYPSLAEELSDEMEEICNRGTVNKGQVENRQSIYMISVDDESNYIAPGYTMMEIHQLKERIDNLKTCPCDPVPTEVSEEDPTKPKQVFNRFVDDFENSSYINASDPEHYAAVINEFLVPPAKQLVYNYKVDVDSEQYIQGNSIVFPFIDYTVASQTAVTNGPVIPPTYSKVAYQKAVTSTSSVRVKADPTTKTVCTTSTGVKEASTSFNYSPSKYTKTINIAGDKKTNVTVYFDFLSYNDILTIKQGSTTIHNTVSDISKISNLTSSEFRKAQKLSSKYFKSVRPFVNKGSAGATYQGKFTITVDPSKGRRLTFTTNKKSYGGYVIEYYTDSSSKVCNTVPINTPTPVVRKPVVPKPKSPITLPPKIKPPVLIKPTNPPIVTAPSFRYVYVLHAIAFFKRGSVPVRNIMTYKTKADADKQLRGYTNAFVKNWASAGGANTTKYGEYVKVRGYITQVKVPFGTSIEAAVKGAKVSKIVSNRYFT